ncbi:hypothetical protein FISHEDRAFT_19883, partial [Fistulina hepatica ATCC 64428]
MGRQRRSRMHHARRDVHRASRSRAFPLRTIDQIQLIDLDPKVRKALESQSLDFDKPGLAQHYCVECAHYYETNHALESHWKSKVHKRRCKQLREKVYTVEDAEAAGGAGRETR